MKDLIINSLELICKIGVALMLLTGLLGGWYLSGNPYVAIAGLVLAFIASVITFGILFLLIDLNDNIRQLRYVVEKNSETPQK